MKIDKEITPFRIVGDYESGQLYKSMEATGKWLLIGQWNVNNEIVNVVYDYPQEIDCSKIIATALEVRKINYESDFTAVINTDIFFNFDFEIVFQTTGNNKYIASRKNGEYINCKKTTDGKIEIIFKNHNLPEGELINKTAIWVTNEDMPDGFQKEVSPDLQPIELIDGKTDSATDIGLNIVLPYALVDAYDIAVSNGYKGTKEDYIKLISNPPKKVYNPTGITHHRAISYNSLPNEVYTYGYMRFKLVDGINEFDITGIIGHIDVGSGSVKCYYGEDVPGRLDIPTLRAWIENNILYIDNTGLIAKKCCVKLNNGYVMFDSKRNLINANPAQAVDKIISAVWRLSDIRVLIGFGGPYNTPYIVDVVNVADNYSYDYEVYKNTRNHIKDTDKYIRRKKWVRGDMLMRRTERIGVSIGRCSRINKNKETGEERYSFLMRIRRSNKRRTRSSQWLYLRCNLVIQDGELKRINLVKA